MPDIRKDNNSLILVNRVRASCRAGLWNLSRVVLQQTPRSSESGKSWIAGVIVSDLPLNRSRNRHRCRSLTLSTQWSGE
jgi:hypothetical protein